MCENKIGQKEISRSISVAASLQFAQIKILCIVVALLFFERCFAEWTMRVSAAVVVVHISDCPTLADC